MMLSYQQPTMQTQEDLAALFARNMVLNPDLASQYQTQQQQQQQQQPRPEPIQTQVANTQPITSQAPPNTAPITYSISQHYHHSTHIVRPPPQAQAQEQPQPSPFQRGSSEPPQSEQESCEALLRTHGVDPAALNPSQMQLFRVAGADQKARLLELWSICPPTSTRGEDPSLAWTTTTVEQEEQLARLRYDRQQQLEQQHLRMQMNYGNYQAADGRWSGGGGGGGAEPYMEAGYEELVRREAEEQQQRLARATDPVYKGASRALLEGRSWNGVSWPSTAPAGTADAMDIL